MGISYSEAVFSIFIFNDCFSLFFSTMIVIIFFHFCRGDDVYDVFDISVESSMNSGHSSHLQVYSSVQLYICQS